MSTSYTPSVGDTGEWDPLWPKCSCGLGAILVVAWTEKNVGRRFYGCQNYGNPSFCGFHIWYDDPTPPHLKETILGVRADGRYVWRRVEAAEAEVENLKKLLANAEASLKKLKEERDDVLDELSYVELLGNDASEELKVVKEEASRLNFQVKNLKQQRIWLAFTGIAILGMYWLD